LPERVSTVRGVTVRHAADAYFLLKSTGNNEAHERLEGRKKNEDRLSPYGNGGGMKVGRKQGFGLIDRLKDAGGVLTLEAWAAGPCRL
jgi:hypothetical protein